MSVESTIGKLNTDNTKLSSAMLPFRQYLQVFWDYFQKVVRTKAR